MDKTKWDILRADFPKEAYSEDNSRGFKLTTINAYYIIERLNTALGICGEGWWFNVKEWIKNEKEVICIGDLLYFDGDKPCSVKDVVGSHKVVHENWGDCYKSARTNAISKGASELEVGLNVYKGEFKSIAGQKPSPSTPRPVEQQSITDTSNLDLNSALGFGKNKDNTWGTVDMEYLGWLAGQDGKRAEQAKTAIQLRMEANDEFKIADEEPPPDPAQDTGDEPF